MPLDTERTARLFHWFADHECADEPLYAAMCRIVASQPALLDLLAAAPAEQQRPNLWLAAVHDLLLAGVAHPLAQYYGSLGGTQAPDAALAAHLADFVAHHRTALAECMASHSTQTNEIGRSAVLWPALQTVALRTGHMRLALLDLGCSAGLNLGVDHFSYDDGDGAPPTAGRPVLSCRQVGPLRPPEAPVQIVQRLGIDPAPVDVNDARAVRWLRACLWPSNVPRVQRFDQAVALAQREAWPVRREPDCTAALAPWLDSLPADVQPVVVNTWVLTYFEPSALQRHLETVEALVRERGLAWVSCEGPELPIGGLTAPPPFEGDAGQRGSLWTLCWRSSGQVRYELLARSHPHGRWLEWLASSPVAALRNVS